MKNVITSISLFFLILVNLLEAGELGPFQLKHYDEQLGLSTNLTKRIKCDNTGFMWISSDGGLIRYDGDEFLILNNILPSSYTKDVVVDSSGRVFVVSDFGFGEIINPRGRFKDISYRTILDGSLKSEKNKLYYPKSSLIDSRGRIWISELDGITLLDSGNVKKYYIEQKYHPDSYLSSYHVREDSEGNIYAACWRGYLLKYIPSKDRFEEVHIDGITQLTINDFGIYDQRFVIGTNSGLFEIDGIYNDHTTLIPIIPNLSISTFLNFGNDFLLGTWDDGLFLYTGGDQQIEKIETANLTRAVYLEEDLNGGIWCASENGVFLLTRAAFRKVDIFSMTKILENAFISKIAALNETEFVFSNQENIYRINIDDKKALKIPTTIDGPIYDFEAGDENIIVSYRSGEIYFETGSGVIHRRIENDRLSFVGLDDNGEVWGLLEQQNIPIKIDKNGAIKEYKFDYNDKLLPIYLKVVEGEIILGLTGDGYHLAKYSAVSDEFVPFGTRIDPGGRFRVRLYDIEKIEDTYYLATNLSLLEMKGYAVKVNESMASLGSPNVRAVERGINGDLWLGTDRGIFLLSQDGTSYFNKNDGLPNSTITIEGLITDKYNRLWASTPNGIAISEKDILGANVTPKPVFIESSFFNTKNKEVVSSIRDYKAGTGLFVRYTSLFYPTDNIEFEVSLLGNDNHLHEITSINTIRYTNLQPGDYRFSVRAKKDGYKWSKAESFNFTVYSPWYLKPGMMIVYGFFVIGVVIIIVMIINAKRVKNLELNRKELELLVLERTKDLEEEKRRVEHYLQESVNTSEELKKLNEFKGELLSIAAHDLKNPLQSILGLEQILAEEEDLSEDSREAVEIIFEAATNMFNIIKEVLDNALTNAADLQLHKTEINLSDLLNNIISQNKILASRKNQTIISDIQPEVYGLVDKVWMKNIFDNLISNAIKYSPLWKNIWIKLEEKNSQIHFSIKDEGPGFTEDDKEKLFTKFQKLSAKPTGSETSTGLGLFIVKELVNRHEGTIVLKSTLGEGAEFIITLRK